MEHPGGSDILMENAGGDASLMFEAIGHSDEAQEIKETYRIGDLEGGAKRKARL